MTSFEEIKCVYFLGVGGIGMSAIARYFKHQGKEVQGYDKTETTLTKQLVDEGIHIQYEDRPESVQHLDQANTLVVLTPAVPKDHGELNFFRSKGFKILKRSEVLGLLSEAFETIGVAGTHGKTTTSTLLAHLLTQSSVGCSAFLGGISVNYGSNLLLNQNSGNPQWLVVEADEFDRSFLTLHPKLSIITSTDADHLDIYGEHAALRQSFEDYANRLRPGGTLFLNENLDLMNDLTNLSAQAYGFKQNSPIYADAIQILGDINQFDLHVNGVTLKNIQLGIPGLHNIENAVAASAAALAAGVSPDELRNGLESFRGVKRRFEYIIKSPERIFIDDYAHHPTELRAIIGSVKRMYPDKKLTAVFQPHLYSRTRDFAEGFAESLSLADEVYLLDIYPARELPIEGVDSDLIFRMMTLAQKHRISKSELPEAMARLNPELLLTVGAGDIDTTVEPIKNKLLGH